MKWRGRKRSSNIEDRRSTRRGLPAAGPKSLLLMLLLGGLAVYFGADPSDVLTALSRANLQSSVSGSGSNTASEVNKNDPAVAFVSVVLADTEQTWRELLAKEGMRYQEPKLVLFRDQVASACGYSSAAVGPFYCPADQKVYLDLSFFKELSRMGAAGDFAAAYVVAHEIGHHVQNLMGVLPEVQRKKQMLSKVDANALQVRVELQADCFAGLWAFFANTRGKMLEPGDIEEGIAAASAVGDDTIMKRAGQQVRPEGFTHGSARQRIHWLKTGLNSGSLAACNTFAERG